MKPFHWWHSQSCCTTCTFNDISYWLFKFHSFKVLSFAMNVVSGGKRTFYVFQPMNTLFYRFEWWYPLWLNETLDVLISIGTLCDLSMCWIHLMVLGFMVKKLEWHPKLNVLWVFKWKLREWVVGFGLVDSLALVPF
jgi:hypothetical protein